MGKVLVSDRRGSSPNAKEGLDWVSDTTIPAEPSLTVGLLHVGTLQSEIGND